MQRNPGRRMRAGRARRSRAAFGLFVVGVSFVLGPAPGIGGEGADERGGWPGPRTVVGAKGMLAPEVREAIAPVRIGGVQWGGAVWPGDVGTRKAQRLEADIAGAHDAGARYIGSINGPGFHLRSLPDEAMRTLDLRPQHRPDSKTKVFKCLLRPKVFQAFIETARRAVDMGMDGFVLDGWSMGSQLCFCDRCLVFYREVLARNGDDDPALGALETEVDPQTFDYRGYLLARGVEPGLPAGRIPFGRAFKGYRAERILAEKRRFWTEVRAYADAKGARSFALTANVYAVPWKAFAVHDLLDYFLVETPFFGVHGGFPPEGGAIALHKKARMAGRRAVLQMANIDTVRRLIGRKSNEILLKIWIAEAHASGNLFSYSTQTHGGTQLDRDERVKTLDLPAKALAPYYAFLQAHPEIYAETTSPARVGVLYFMAPKIDAEFRAICKLLEDAHRLFDAVLIGDGHWNRTVPTDAALARYRALVLPLAKKALPPAVEAALSRYVEGGGRLLLASEFSRVRRIGEDPGLRALAGLASREEGDPRVWDLLPYREARAPALREAFVRALGAEPVLTTDASPDVAVLVWQADGRTLVHLVNQTYVEAEDRVVDQASIRVHVPFPAARAIFHSPDEPASTPLEIRTDDEGTSFTVPRLHIYGVVVLE